MNVLLVDDEPALRKACRLMLEKAGHSVDVAENGHNALDCLRSATYDVLLTDIIMPDKEGIELIIEVRQSHPNLPIIAMSGGGRVDARNYLGMAEKLGCAAVIEKPFTREELLLAVRQAGTHGR